MFEKIKSLMKWTDEARQATAESRRGSGSIKVVEDMKGNLRADAVRNLAGKVAAKGDLSKVPRDEGVNLSGKPREKFWETKDYKNGMVTLKYNDEHPDQPDSGTVTSNLFVGHATAMANAGYEFKGYKEGTTGENQQTEYVFAPVGLFGKIKEEISKSWSDSAREAAAEARRGHASDTTMGGITSQKPSAGEKALYVRIKDGGGGLTQFAVHNRKVGVAEGKARAWVKRADFFKTFTSPGGYPGIIEANSRKARQCLHIAESYKRVAVKESGIRDNL